MADLQAMFQNLGPTGGALMSGIQMGQQYNANESEQAMRQLQMDKILQETEQAKLMNPLALQAKQQEVSDAQLKAKREDHAYMTKLLGDAIPTLEKVKDLPGQRLAALKQYAESHGRPLSEQDLTQYSQDPALLDTLKAQHKWAITEDAKYRQAYDVAEMQRKSAEKIAAGHDASSRYAADTRAQTAKDRAAASASDAAMMTKLAGNYAGQQAYYEKKAREAYLAGDDSQYAYYTQLRDKAKQQELDKASASQNARAGADAARLEALGGGSGVVKPPKALTPQQMRDAL